MLLTRDELRPVTSRFAIWRVGRYKNYPTPAVPRSPKTYETEPLLPQKSLSLPAMTYPLTVLAATEILEEVMTYQQDVTKCAVCFQRLGDDTYLICDFPVADGAVREVKKVHQGHTACKSCVEARDYVGEKGACVACLNDVTKPKYSARLASADEQVRKVRSKK